MRRVYAIRTLRYVFSGITASCLLLLLTLYGIGRQVWVARVFENAPADFGASLQFFISAFSHTDILVQALSLLALISLVYLARATAHLLTSSLTPVRV